MQKNAFCQKDSSYFDKYPHFKENTLLYFTFGLVPTYLSVNEALADTINKIIGLGLEINLYDSIPEDICKLTNIHYLSCNYFDTTKQEFPKELECLKNIRVLNFHASNLISFPKFILSLDSLKQLSLSINSIDEIKIPDELCRLDHLNKFVIHGTPKGGFNNLLCLKSLAEFSIFNDKTLSKIPKEIFKLKHLIRLEFLDTNLKKIPRKVKVFKKLELLIFSDNNYIEKLPRFIGKMKNLKYIGIYGTSIEKLPKFKNKKTYCSIFLSGFFPEEVIDKYKKRYPNMTFQQISLL